MHTFKIALLASAGLLTFTACTDGVGLPDWDLDTADTGFYDDIDPVIDQVTFSCDYGSPDTWSFFSRMDGWAGIATLDIFETGDGNWPGDVARVWDEHHTMVNTDYDEQGAWDEWSLSLRKVDTINQQVAGQTTLFGCEWNDGGSLAFMETIYDDNSRELDCVIWGHESQQYFNGYMGENCLCFDNDGICTN